MRSPLEIIEGDFRHALFTTYTIGLPFFERWVLPLLAAAGVRNVTVFADAAMLGTSLLDPHVQLAGRIYNTHGVDAHGVFHSKLILLVSERHSRLCVSSANLTVSGQLRNLESAAAFDSTIAGHAEVIKSAGEYFRRLAVNAPVHIAEAVFDALSALEEPGDEPVAVFRHNLDEPLIESIPDGPIQAAAPFADVYAAASMSEGRDLTVVVDGSTFEAEESFFEGRWSISPRRFGRSLHGKAYWQPNETWSLIGSPNMTSAGLLRRAKAGNYETAVEFTSVNEPLALPNSDPWDGEPIGEVAPRRRRSRSGRVEPEKIEQVGSFSAWEEDGDLMVDQLPDGCEVMYADGLGWSRLGTTRSSRLAVPSDTRPHLLRADVGTQTRYAIVHRVSELRIRRHRRPRTEKSSALEGSLPLEPEGQRILEGVLGELFALASLVHEDRENRIRLSGQREPSEHRGEERLTEWVPANPEDEPRIPELYSRVLGDRESIDVLLALARTALRLEEPIDPLDVRLGDESLASDESLDLEDVEEAEDVEDVEEEQAPIQTTRAVLERYRNTFMRRLDEVVAFIKKVPEQDLCDLAFQVALVQQERLTLEVDVDGETVPLVEPKAMFRQRLDLLEAYLKGDGDDPRCLETARFHLASCLQTPDAWTPREWEKLEDLAYAHGRRLLEAERPLSPVDSLLGMDSAEAADWIEHLSDRTDWQSISDHASGYLEGVTLETSPFPYIIGEASYSEISHAPGREGSPAWDVIGYGAVAGLADDEPYGVGVANVGSGGAFDAHVVVAAPAESRLYESVRRRTDSRWMVRYYTPIGRRLLENAGRLGPTVLSEAFRQPWEDTDVVDMAEPVRLLVEGLLKQLGVASGG